MLLLILLFVLLAMALWDKDYDRLPGLVLIALWMIYEEISSPLSDDQIEAVAKTRRNKKLCEVFTWDSVETAVDPSFKAEMDPEGAIHQFLCPMRLAPANVAALLKWKKHEWIVFVFCKEQEAKAVYFNKGPNNSVVWPHISTQQIMQLAKSVGADILLCLHNHPNGVLWPSEADLTSATSLGEICCRNRIAFFDFVCAAGRFREYFAAVPATLMPLQDFVNSVLEMNQGGSLPRLKLRWEWLTTKSLQIRRFRTI